MKWSRFHDDPRRLRALADILLGAAYADGELTVPEQIEIGARLLKAMGETHLSADLESEIHDFDPKRFELPLALATLALEDKHERVELVSDVAAVISADSRVESHERIYLWRLAAMLAIPVDEVMARVGPEWPARTRPHARPRPHSSGGAGET